MSVSEELEELPAFMSKSAVSNELSEGDFLEDTRYDKYQQIEEK